MHTPYRTKANMRAFMWDRMKDWLLHGATETDEKMEMFPWGEPGALEYFPGPSASTWGPSSSVNSVELQALAGSENLAIEMQSGGVLEIVSREVSVKPISE